MNKSKLLHFAYFTSIWLCSCQDPSGPEGPPPPPPVPEKPHRISVLHLGGQAELDEIPAESLKDGMKLFQFKEGDHYALEVVDLKGDVDSLPKMLEETVRDGADFIVITHPKVVLAALAYEVRRPIVFGILGDPLVLGVGTSDDRHLRNLTGSYNPLPAYSLLALVRYYLPKAKRVGVVFYGREPLSAAHKDAMIKDSARVQMDIVAVESGGEDGLSAAIDDLVGKSIDAVCLVAGPGSSNARVIDRARRAKVPVFGFSEDQVRAGALAVEVPDAERVGIEAGRMLYQVAAGVGPQQLPLRRLIDTTTLVNTSIADELAIALPPGALRNARSIGRSSSVTSD